MIDLYYWTTPNGHKITIFLEEAGLKYQIIPVNIGKGEQFERKFLDVSPNNRIPAIVDHEPAGGGEPICRLRIRRDPALSRREDRQFLSRDDLRGRAPMPAMAVLADGRARPDGRAEPSFQQLRAGKDPLRHRPLRKE